MSYLKRRRSALGFALSGLIQALRTEPHLKIHLIAGCVVIACGCYLHLLQTEWLALIGCITLVISLELINSAIEKLCDLLMPEQHPAIKYVKDVAAAAVLIACIASVVIGSIIFWKYIRICFIS